MSLSILQNILEQGSGALLDRKFGVYIGLVTNNVDPEGLGRIKVRLPSFHDVDESNWARIVTPMAGKGMGIYFLPEVNDEVLIAFEAGDMRRPLVLGSLWNGRAKPPEKNDGGNHRRVLKSRSGLKLIFDDTPGSEKIKIDASGKTVEIVANLVDVKKG